MNSSRFFRRTIAEVNLGNLKNNFLEVKKNIGNAYVCPMIKANAYGHGDVEAARILISAGAERLGVCLIEEAIGLRNEGIEVPILVFDPFDDYGAQAMLEHELTPVISSWNEFEYLSNHLRENQVSYVHCKFNTGMNRLGFEVTEAQKIYDFFKENKNFRLQGICSHLSHGHDAGLPNGYTAKQISKFLMLEKFWKPSEIPFHILNSSAIFSYKKGKTSLGARPGLSLYGAIPENKTKVKCNLSPVMAIKSAIALCRKIKKREIVSYSGRWRAKKDSVVAVVPIGYEDGYFRCLTNKAEMLFRGKRVSVVGTVCMDYTMVDLTAVTKGKVVESGEEIVILGAQGKDEITSMEIAKWGGTIAYEVMTSVGNRIHRKYLR